MYNPEKILPVGGTGSILRKSLTTIGMVVEAG
jgi:hypothetical protein